MRWASTLIFLALTGKAHSDVTCKVFEVDIQSDNQGVGSTEYHCVPDAADAGGGNGISYVLKGLNPSFTRANEAALRSGLYYITVSGAYPNDRSQIFVPPGAAVSLASRGERRQLRSRERSLAPKSAGTSNVLVLRVIANDASTTASVSSLSDSVFGTSGDAVNLKSQYGDCSYDKLVFNPATGTDITDGVGEVTIDIAISGQSRTDVMNAVTQAATTKYGDLTNFDHVMYCLPPGTESGWIAFGYYNWYRTVYNDNWCTYLSGQMHEFGHNLNLRHAGEGSNAYGDQTGMMGYSYSSDDGPVMCFNGPKSWQLGWYSDRHTTVDPTSASGAILLAPINDYGETTSAHTVVLKIEAGSNSYFMVYNKAEGINSGTRESANLVMVASQAGTASSSKLAALNVGGTYTISGFAGGTDSVVIEVCDIVTGTPDYAQVSVHLENGVFASTCPGAPQPEPVASPASPPSSSSTCISLSSWTDDQCVTNCGSTSCHKQCSNKCSSQCSCNGGVSTPVSTPVSIPAASPVSPPTGSCGGNKADCSSGADCCSGKCGRGTCKGG